MRRKENQLAVGSFCRPLGDAPAVAWRPGTILRIAKRESNWLGYETRYFCVAVGDDYGYGSWVQHNRVAALTPLELLALQCE